MHAGRVTLPRLNRKVPAHCKALPRYRVIPDNGAPVQGLSNCLDEVQGFLNFGGPVADLVVPEVNVLGREVWIDLVEQIPAQVVHIWGCRQLEVVRFAL